MARLAIVLTHYRMPVQRLDDWIRWNRDACQAAEVTAWVVSEVPRRVPDWMRVVIYPVEMDVFSLSRTSNFGVRFAIDSGAEIVCKTDPDCILTPTLLAAIASMPPGVALCPVYQMADDATPEAVARSRAWEASKGTLALSASSWDALSGYDERQEGYGIEDGDLYGRARTLLGPSHCVRGEHPIYHVAHSRAKQAAGNLRPDCWGRESGYNPRNHRANMTSRRTPWSCADWGRAIAT